MKKSNIRNLVYSFGGATIFVLFTLLIFYLVFLGKIYPGVRVGNIPLEGMRVPEAKALLEENITIPKEITLSYPEISSKISLSDLEFSFDSQKTAQKAYEFGRTTNPFLDIAQMVLILKNNINMPIVVTFNNEKFENQLAKISEEIHADISHPKAIFRNGQLIIERGSKGIEVAKDNLKELILSKLAYLDSSPIEIPVKITDPTLTDKQAKDFEQRLLGVLAKKIKLTIEDQEFAYRVDELLSLFNPYFPKADPYQNPEIDKLLEDLSPKVERETQNPTFVFLDGKVQEFAPAMPGITINKEEFKLKIKEALWKLEEEDAREISFEIPVNKTLPNIQTEDINNLGIKELIGKGSSRFRGSITSRIHNISLASSRLNGILIEPGQTLSFNKALGDVSKFTGYKEAYVIRDGKTVLGDGGGVCQVSTTLFRAALSAGLPITERMAHSYRVGYYEQDSPPGLDATVYDPTTDLKIKNDTPGHILIQTKVDTKLATLVFELYGTSDGRTREMTKPIITDQVPPPEDVYIDDPTLPPGQVKQIEYKAWGAKVKFDYTVKREGETIYKKTFYSNYHPWQTVYLRGVGPIQ